jgi:hypothetical protein
MSDDKPKLPPLPIDVLDLACPMCGTVTEFDLAHLMATELLYCHECCKAYSTETWHDLEHGSAKREV